MNRSLPDDLRRIYGERFASNLEYRREIWRALVSNYFQRFVGGDDAVLDLGCGYGEFINAVRCGSKLGMDLNPDSAKFLAGDVTLLQQDCASPWQLQDASLDVVFTSNFLEHLPDKVALGRTLDETYRCLKPGGRLVALGPNIKYLAGRYWDFWDHHVALTELSLREALVTRGFAIKLCVARFLPYTMAAGPRYPVMFLKVYLRVRAVWPIFGRQFLVVAVRPPDTQRP